MLDLTFNTITDAAKEDFHALCRQITTNAASTAKLVNTITDHLFSQGGKRLRPLLLLLSARACGYTGEAHITLGTVIEYIHTATLLHDDVVDQGALRRGKPAAHTRFGNPAAILVGDFLYSRAFQLMAQVGSLRVMQCYAETTNQLAEGEAQQLLNSHHLGMTESDYLNIIRAKTAKLFETAARLGPILAESPPNIEAGLARFGLHVGTAFQIVDDILDYGEANTVGALGKNPLQDLKEGKVTLPLLYTYTHGAIKVRALIQQAVMAGVPSAQDIATIQTLVRESSALPYAHDLATREIEKATSALSVLPESRFKQGLLHLAEFALNRQQ